MGKRKNIEYRESAKELLLDSYARYGATPPTTDVAKALGIHLGVFNHNVLPDLIKSGDFEIPFRGKIVPSQELRQAAEEQSTLTINGGIIHLGEDQIADHIDETIHKINQLGYLGIIVFGNSGNITISPLNTNPSSIPINLVSDIRLTDWDLQRNLAPYHTLFSHPNDAGHYKLAEVEELLSSWKLVGEISKDFRKKLLEALI